MEKVTSTNLKLDNTSTKSITFEYVFDVANSSRLIKTFKRMHEQSQLVLFGLTVTMRTASMTSRKLNSSPAREKGYSQMNLSTGEMSIKFSSPGLRPP